MATPIATITTAPPTKATFSTGFRSAHQIVTLFSDVSGVGVATRDDGAFEEGIEVEGGRETEATTVGTGGVVVTIAGGGVLTAGAG